MKRSWILAVLTLLILSACAGQTAPSAPPTALPPNTGQGAQPAAPTPLPGPQNAPPPTAQPGSAPTSAAPPPDSGPTLEPYTLDLSALPIGDSRLSTGPQQGYLWQCTSPGSGGGAQATGDWFNLAAGTWNPSLKPKVDGSVTWPGQFSVTVEGDTRVITGNGLPNHPTGVYPVAQSDDAYQFDRNPNSIKENPIAWRLPAHPTLNAQPQCVHAGLAGILLTGAVFFDATDALNRDAVAHEIQDNCDGHPQSSGVYHYHSVSPCADPGDGPSGLVGYAADGFGITGYRDANGRPYTDADLDECHGTTSLIEWDGQMVMMYHYVATYEYPYTIGCYRGTPVVSDQPGQGGQPGGNQQGGGQPGGNQQGGGTQCCNQQGNGPQGGNQQGNGPQGGNQQGGGPQGGSQGGGGPGGPNGGPPPGGGPSGPPPQNP